MILKKYTLIVALFFTLNAVSLSKPLAFKERSESPNSSSVCLDAEGRAWDWQMICSQHVFRKGDICVRPDQNINHGFKVYKNGQLLLHQSNRNVLMWLGFAYKGRPAREVRMFDGKRGNFISAKNKTAFSPFMNFTGAGPPQLVFVLNVGNGGSVYSVYSLGKVAKRLGVIQTVRSEVSFMDVDGDGLCEVLTHDPTFYGWETCNALSPYPFVVLKFRNQKFELATSLMKTSPPSLEAQKNLITKWRRACEQADAASPNRSTVVGENVFYLAPAVWGDLLDLIYSGNSKVGFKLLDEFWMPNLYARNLEYKEGEGELRTTRAKFKKLFLMQLSSSEFFNRIKQMNPMDTDLQSIRTTTKVDAWWKVVRP